MSCVFFANGMVDTPNISSWIVVFSFILGFFSGRTIELLRSLKDAILPQGSNGGEPVKKKEQTEEVEEEALYAYEDVLENQAVG